jgi:hypothetical protein
MLIDWENNKCRIENMLLVPTMNQVLEVKCNFYDLSFTHIYKELNTKVDQLSEEVMLLQEGFLYEQEFRGGTQISN